MYIHSTGVNSAARDLNENIDSPEGPGTTEGSRDGHPLPPERVPL